MNLPVLPFVETMITQACNLGCQGCTNYSDLTRSGYLTWDQGLRQIEPWLQRVSIPDFGIMGGEPLINPTVRQWIKGIRQLMPLAQIRFTTNGLLLSKHLDIVDLAAEVGNIVFKIGVHVADLELENNINYILNRYDWQEVTEWGIRRYRTQNNFRLQISRPQTFWKTFRNDYAHMAPHDSNPAESFALCCQKTCPLLYEGKIFKCSTTGLLSGTLAKVGNPNPELWQPYLVDGLAPDCTDQALADFLGNFGQPHRLCRQCPAPKDLDSRIEHRMNVVRK